MFKLIAVRYGGFAIMDTEDGAIDVCDESEVMNFLKVGIEIAGIQPLFEQGTFQYDDSNFVSVEDDEDDEEFDGLEKDKLINGPFIAIILVYLTYMFFMLP